MKVIFCDVDGVLNNNSTRDRTPSGYRGISNDLVRNLRRIVDATGAVIVLSSDWRLIREDPVHKRDYWHLLRKLRFAGCLRLYGHTDDIGWDRRGDEIRKYLDQHTDVTSFVILDDIPFGSFGKEGLLDHLVLTDAAEGLTEKDVKQAIRILNRQEETFFN